MEVSGIMDRTAGVFKIEQTGPPGCQSQLQHPNLSDVIGPQLVPARRWEGHERTIEEWKNLCEQAAVEQDRVKLHQLVRRMNDLLEAREARLKGAPRPPINPKNLANR